MNSEQIKNLWQGALVVLVPPLTAFLVTGLGLPGEKVKVTLDFLGAVIPVAWVGWITYKSSARKQVEAVAALPPSAVREALLSVPVDAKVKIAEATLPDTAKVLLANAVPGVATVVIKDTANGALGTLAQSVEHRDIVTETQNRSDAFGGQPKPSTLKETT